MAVMMGTCLVEVDFFPHAIGLSSMVEVVIFSHVIGSGMVAVAIFSHVIGLSMVEVVLMPFGLSMVEMVLMLFMIGPLQELLLFLAAFGQRICTVNITTEIGLLSMAIIEKTLGLLSTVLIEKVLGLLCMVILVEAIGLFTCTVMSLTEIGLCSWIALPWSTYLIVVLDAFVNSRVMVRGRWSRRWKNGHIL